MSSTRKKSVAKRRHPEHALLRDLNRRVNAILGRLGTASVYPQWWALMELKETITKALEKYEPPPIRTTTFRAAKGPVGPSYNG